MNVLLIDRDEGRLEAHRSRFEAAGCKPIRRAWQIVTWADVNKTIDDNAIDLAVVHDTDIVDRTTLAQTKIPVVVYSGGTVSLPQELQSQKRVVPFPIPIDRGDAGTEQQRRYVDYLVRSLAGKSPAEITSDLFDAKTRSFPYVYALVLLARTRLTLAAPSKPARRTVVDPNGDGWWNPLQGPSGNRKELLSEIAALTKAAVREAENGADFLQQLRAIVEEPRWIDLTPELLGDLEELLRAV
jgi:hypothetical protein